MQEKRAKEMEMEMVWESSQDLGEKADLFTGKDDSEEYDDDDDDD